MAFSSPLHFRNPYPIFSPKPTKPALRPVTFKPLPALPSVAADVDSATIADICGGSVAALADPERRRKLQAEEVIGGDKEVVKDYFNKSACGVTVCDAGCGTGCLAIPLANEGAAVTASDISASMVAEAEKQAREQLDLGKEGLILPKFEVSDLESLGGKYDTVVCLDMLIHYPQSKADGMIAHLASLAEKRLLVSFAPKTFYYDILKRIGEFFPGPSKATRAYLHSEADVERALNKVGWRIRKRGLTTTQFYFSRLVEAVPL